MISHLPIPLSSSKDTNRRDNDCNGEHIGKSSKDSQQHLSISPSSPSYLICNGLRYAIPYDSISQGIQIKDKFVDHPLTLTLATMFRRHRGTQPIEESTKHWSKEIQEGRVEIRHHKKPTPKKNEQQRHHQHLGDTPSNRNEAEHIKSYDWIKASLQDVVTHRMLVRFIQHVHELVVPASSGLLDPIKILWESEDHLAIFKPGGIATTDENVGQNQEGQSHRGVNSLLQILMDQMNQRNDVATDASGPPPPLSGTSKDNEKTGYPNKSKNKKLNLNLTPAHRLDKPVSGVLLLGKTPGKAATLMRQIQLAEKEGSDGDEGHVAGCTSTKSWKPSTRSRKVYLARVKRHIESIPLVLRKRDDVSKDQASVACYSKLNENGRDGETIIENVSSRKEFPADTFYVEAELGWNSKQKRAYVLSKNDADGQYQRRKASLAGSVKKEKKRVHEAERRMPKKQRQKEARGDKSAVVDSIVSQPTAMETTTEKPKFHTTRFRRLSSNGGMETDMDGTTLIECCPLTGTRHQIRAHLAAIGWPIANDTIYLREKTYHTENNDLNDGASAPAAQNATTHQPTKEEQLFAYIDDDHGTLKKALCSHTRPWCTKCQWTMRMLSSQKSASNQVVRSNGKDEDEEVTTSSPPSQVQLRRHGILVAGPIWLHSWRYVLPSIGIDVTAPVPDWAKMCA